MYKLLCLLAGLLMFTSCTKDSDAKGEFQLSFAPLFGDEFLILNKEYALDSIDVKFENLTFIMTDLALVNEDEETVALSEAEFVELNGFDEASASKGAEISFPEVPEGHYTRIKFSIGVAEDLNAKMPGDFQVDEPLGRSDHYWEAWGSYIFSKTEGSADVDGDGDFDLKFFYHTGSDALRRDFIINVNLVIDEEFPIGLEMFMDYNELLRNADRTAFDIESNPRNHDPTKLEIVTQYVDNYSRGLKVRN